MKKLGKALFHHTSSLPLACFRIAFGIIMALQFAKFWQAFSLDYVNRSYFIKYDYFEWVQLPPEAWLSPIFIVLIGFSVLFVLGVWYRLAAFALFVGMSFCFFIEKSMYNNHYYLFILLSFLMIFVNGNAALAISKSAATNIPNWQILIIRLQLFILYFYGGIAKLNHDWLVSAQPVKIWLPDMLGTNYDGLSSEFLNFFAYFISYSGLLIDLSVGFLLLSKKWKWLAIVVLVIFHSSNMLMFSIGYFPLFGILSLVIFLEKDELSKLIPSILLSNKPTLSVYKSSTIIAFWFIVWLTVQALIPLRHWLLPGKVQWQMNGYLFSWFMKLNDSAPLLRFEVSLPNSDERFTFEMEKLSESPMQRNYIAAYPFVAVQFANDIETYLKEKNEIKGDIKIYCDSYVSLNGREFQRKLDPTVDLTALEFSKISKYLTRHEWITPLGNDTLVDKTVIYRLKKLQEKGL